MMLTELTAVPASALPVAALRDHLHLGAGFALAEGQEALLESHLRAAMAVIEGRIAKALIARRFRWETGFWRDPAEVALPLAPVSQVGGVTLVDAAGGAVVLDPVRWQLVPDLHRPQLTGRGAALPAVPADGKALVEFDAGFGPDWSDVPPDLGHAVLLLAAEFYEHRHDDGGTAGGLPLGVTALIERWRQVRVLGGRGRR